MVFRGVEVKTGKMVRPDKVQEVELLTEKLTQANAVVLVDFRGLDVQSAEELRNRCRDAEVEYRVVKNTLLHLAAEEVGIEGLDDLLAGPTALAISYEDPVAPAHEIKEFSDEFGVLEIKGGVLEGIRVETDEVLRLADLPSREVLLGQVASCFAAPMRRAASVMQAPVRDLAYAVSEVQKKSA